MSFPLVSIIIPIYNRAHLIRETLDSVYSQTYANWECLIVDDGSTDKTSEVVAEYVEKDSRFKFHHRPVNRLKGGNAARNYGFEVSQGEYIKWFDSDDIMFPDFLEKQVALMLENTEISFCACQNDYFGDGLMESRQYVAMSEQNHALYSFFIQGNVFLTPAPLWKMEFLKGKDLFDEVLTRGQEFDFHFRMLTDNPNFILTNDSLYTVRRGHTSIESSSKTKKAQISVLRVLTKAFDIIKKNDFAQKRVLLQYLVYRNLAQMSVLILLEKNVFKRLQYVYFYKSLIEYSKTIGFLKFCKVSVGMFFLILCGKGYRLVHLNEFDYRQRLKINKEFQT